MGHEQTGADRVTVFPLTHHRPDRRITLAQQMYGHDVLHTGTLTLDDRDLMKRALQPVR